jgi:hypothetical protein
MAIIQLISGVLAAVASAVTLATAVAEYQIRKISDRRARRSKRH